MEKKDWPKGLRLSRSRDKDAWMGKTTSSHICTETQRNQRDGKSKNEGGGRQKLKHAGGDFPLCMRRESGDNETKMSENEDPKRKRRKQTQISKR